MDQTPHTGASASAPPEQELEPPSPEAAAAVAPPEAAAPVAPPGFRERGRVRRRARYLRKARELAYRDLGGLVFNLHRFGQRNDALVLGKLNTLSHIDGELRALEGALDERQPVSVLREAGITPCPRCAAIHSSEDHYCPNCGLPVSRHVDLPIAGAASAPEGGPRGPEPSPAPAASAPPGGVLSSPSPAPSAAPATSPAATPRPAPSAPSSLPTRPAPAPVAASPSASSAPGGPPSPAPGRSPVPPAPAQPPAEEDQPTEIVRPRTAG